MRNSRRGKGPGPSENPLRLTEPQSRVLTQKFVLPTWKIEQCTDTAHKQNQISYLAGQKQHFEQEGSRCYFR